MIRSVEIGDVRLWLATYCPRDDYAELLERAACAIAIEHLATIGVDGIHARIRERMPQYAALLDCVEAGGQLPRNAEIGEYPVTPGEEAYTLPIITEIKKGNQ